MRGNQPWTSECKKFMAVFHPPDEPSDVLDSFPSKLLPTFTTTSTHLRIPSSKWRYLQLPRSLAKDYKPSNIGPPSAALIPTDLPLRIAWPRKRDPTPLCPSTNQLGNTFGSLSEVRRLQVDARSPHPRRNCGGTCSPT